MQTIYTGALQQNLRGLSSGRKSLSTMRRLDFYQLPTVFSLSLSVVLFHMFCTSQEFLSSGRHFLSLPVKYLNIEKSADLKSF